MNSKADKILKKENILLGLSSVDKNEAIVKAGKLLAKEGYVDEEYIDAMLEREEKLTTYIGNGVAIPHGVGDAVKYIKKSGIVFFQYPEGVDFNGEKAYLVIGIAGIENQHIEILSNIAVCVGDEEEAAKLAQTKNIEYIYDLFTKNEEESE